MRNKKTVIIMISIIALGVLGAIFLMNGNFLKKPNALTNHEKKKSVDESEEGHQKEKDSSKDDDKRTEKNIGPPSLSELSETEQYMNKGFIISMKVFLNVNQILNKDKEEINRMIAEIEAYENEFMSLKGTDETQFAKLLMEGLFDASYEAIKIYTKRLNGEEIKSITIFDKITIAQEKYLAFAEEFDHQKIPMSKEVLEEVIEIQSDIKRKLDEIERENDD